MPRCDGRVTSCQTLGERRPVPPALGPETRQLRIHTPITRLDYVRMINIRNRLLCKVNHICRVTIEIYEFSGPSSGFTFGLGAHAFLLNDKYNRYKYYLQKCKVFFTISYYLHMDDYLRVSVIIKKKLGTK